jgi:hypothetical protein
VQRDEPRQGQAPLMLILPEQQKDLVGGSRDCFPAASCAPAKAFIIMARTLLVATERAGYVRWYRAEVLRLIGPWRWPVRPRTCR